MQPGESVQGTRRRLEEFKGWLRQRRLVPENRFPSVVIWVERFCLRATRPRKNWKRLVRIKGVFISESRQHEPGWVWSMASVVKIRRRVRRLAPADRPLT